MRRGSAVLRGLLALLAFLVFLVGRDARALPHLRGVAGKAGSGVAIGDGAILYSNTIHQLWALAQGFDPAVRYLGVAATTSGYIVVAEDGSVWNSTVAPYNAFTRVATPTSQPLRAVRAVGARLLAVGAAGTILRSPDALGGSWVAATSGVTSRLNAIAYNTTGIVVVGDDGVILRGSLDGTGWQRATLEETRHFYGVSADPNGLFLAVGAGGMLWKGDASGTVWTRLNETPTAETLRATAAVGLTTVVVGDHGTILYSGGGYQGWAPTNVPTTEDLSAVAFTGGDLVAVGANGTSLWSAIGLVWNPAVVPTAKVTWGQIKLLPLSN